MSGGHNLDNKLEAQLAGAAIPKDDVELNSADMPSNFKEIVAAKFNDASFEPESYTVSNLHEDFAQPMLLSRDTRTGDIQSS
jgi:hypothetical protein